MSKSILQFPTQKFTTLLRQIGYVVFFGKVIHIENLKL